MKAFRLRSAATAIGVGTILLLLSDGARAQTVLYSNFGPGDTFGPTGYQWGVEENQTAALFTPVTDGVATQVDFPAGISFQGGAFTDEIPVGIYANVGGVPGGPPLSTGFAFTISPGITPLYRSAAISPISLSSSESYYFIIGPWVANYSAFGGWTANNTGALGVATLPFGTITWVAEPNLPTPALRIAAAPEPGAVTLAALGLLAACGRTIRQYRRA